jgi:hypothetical protein
MTTTTDVAAAPIIAWRAPSPSSPAPLARRWAAARCGQANWPTVPLTPHIQWTETQVHPFTEISYTSLLTFPIALISLVPSNKLFKGLHNFQ